MGYYETFYSKTLLIKLSINPINCGLSIREVNKTPYFSEVTEKVEATLSVANTLEESSIG
jgi:hypothetical protein